jgi:hypothetical protein
LVPRTATIAVALSAVIATSCTWPLCCTCSKQSRGGGGVGCDRRVLHLRPVPPPPPPHRWCAHPAAKGACKVLEGTAHLLQQHKAGLVADGGGEMVGVGGVVGAWPEAQQGCCAVVGGGGQGGSIGRPRGPDDIPGGGGGNGRGGSGGGGRRADSGGGAGGVGREVGAGGARDKVQGGCLAPAPRAPPAFRTQLLL